MRMMIASVMLSLFMFTAACSSINREGYPVGDGTFKVLRTITEATLLNATTQRSWMEVCKQQVTVPYNWEEARWHWDREYIEYVECTPLEEPKFSQQPWGVK